MKYALLPILIFLVSSFGLQGQTSDQNVARPKSDNIPVAGSEKVDIIFSRTFMFGDAVGANYSEGRSGSYSLGIGYGIPIGRAFEIKIEPRVTWQKLVFTENGDTTKVFPSTLTGTDYIYEKLRMAYVEVPLGIKVKGARNAEDKYKFLFEAGFSFGFNVSSTAKSRFEVDTDGVGGVDSKMTTKVNNIPDLNELRYGPYARIGTNWIAIYGFYRMTEIFDTDSQFNSVNGLINYPTFPQLEIGVSIRI